MTAYSYAQIAMAVILAWAGGIIAWGVIAAIREAAQYRSRYRNRLF